MSRRDRIRAERAEADAFEAALSGHGEPVDADMHGMVALARLLAPGPAMTGDALALEPDLLSAEVAEVYTAQAITGDSAMVYMADVEHISEDTARRVAEAAAELVRARRS